MSASFICAMCSGEFLKGRSDETAMAETRDFFGDILMEDCAIVCHDCFQKINPADHPQLVAEARKHLGTREGKE